VKNIGIVVPTMGKRRGLLIQSLSSIRKAGNVFILVVAPDEGYVSSEIDSELYDAVLLDPSRGLPAAIHAGISELPENIEFVSWLGDDDLLKPNSLSFGLAPLLADPNSVFSFGGCEYIDSDGHTIWINRSGRYAIPLLHFGPQLIPQPGSLIRRTAYTSIGGLNCQYKWAFDLDLLIRLRKIGRLSFVPQTLSCFRWHNDSLTVGGRDGSVKEASEIRRDSLPFLIRLFSQLWEIPMRELILIAGKRMSHRADKTRL
jgi:hypothetical protein